MAVKLIQALLFIALTLFATFSTWANIPAHPNLVITASDVKQMRQTLSQQGISQQGIGQQSRFNVQYQSVKQAVDKQLNSPILIPKPKDGGGGYTHEQHKKNYQLMLNAGIIYQLSQQVKYANLVKDMLLEYAQLYPTLGLHPKHKVKSQNPGKLFWQSLNEAVWLVHTIQAYDLIHPALNANEIAIIEGKLLKPVALFLSQGQPSTFNKVHNHGTWATAGVGMAGYVMNEPQWVEQALYDLEKSGKGGFLAQLDKLFSPQGYYNEGPYYQRYALMPFITFAKAIDNNEPHRKIFDHRNGIILKAIDTTIQLSYNGLFFPINDAIKSKGIDTIELVHGVTMAFGLTGDTGYLDIAKQQDQIILSIDGLKVAQALDQALATPYQFKSVAFGDGSDGKQGALVVMRANSQNESLGQTLLFKPSAQGLGHGHFDKLTWQFYDYGNEIVSDYGAARFLNIEAKYGGRYLPENRSYAKQTVAHNTVVVDQTSHFDFDVTTANKNHPQLNFFASNQHGSLASGEINTAYQGVKLQRTIALVNLPQLGTAIALDVFNLESGQQHQYDLPLHYRGQLIDTNFALKGNVNELRPLGSNNGYQHLWLKGQATPKPDATQGMAQVTWLNENGRFYTHTSLVAGDETFLFTQIGANDPNFNLRNEQGFIRRVAGKKQHTFISVLEPHGKYNPSKEYTLQANSAVSGIEHKQQGDIALTTLDMGSKRYLIATSQLKKSQSFKFNNKSYTLSDHLGVYLIKVNTH